jgi:hypothetical protein
MQNYLYHVRFLNYKGSTESIYVEASLLEIHVTFKYNYFQTL